MNTNVAVLLGAALIAGAVLVVGLNGGSAGDGPDTAVQEPAPGPGGTTPSAPGLTAAPSEHRDARLERELAAARREIAELKARMDAGGGETAAAGATTEEKRARFVALSEAYGTGDITREQMHELLALTKDKELMGLVVAGLQGRIAADPTDLTARMQLAEVQSARVHSAESITERADLGRSVRTQLEAVLAQDADHWDARYMQAVGISHSQRSPQGRANAIRAFESLISLQQGQRSESRFAGTYSQLAEVYVAERNAAKARETLRVGLERHPESKELKDALAKLAE